MLPHSTSRPTIYPYPQWATFGDGAFHVGRSAATVWLDPALSGPALPQAIGDLPMAVTAAASAGEATIAIGLASNGALASRLGAATTGFVPPPEGYRLVVGPDRITVLGADSVGCYYGLCALGQVLRADGEQVTAAVGEVRDWPYKPMRGVHVYMPGRDGIPFFKDLLAWLASMRYNMVFLEVGGGMRYDRHPEVNEAWERFSREVWAYPGGARGLQGSQPYPKDSTHTELGHGSYLEKTEVADIIAHANAYGIEVVPELQSLSHAYYMCLAHPEIAERPYDPWPDTYCPSDPRSYELYFDLVDEVIEVFRPRMLHIGHDELYTIGVCDRCRGKSGAELLAGDLIKVHDYLAARGVRTVLWGDKLQNIIIGGVDHGGRARRHTDPAKHADHTMRETYQAVDFVPKDMLIMDWYWSLDPNSERFFQRKGFEVIFGNFGDNYAPQTFRGWDRRAAGQGITGAEVSTWCDLSEYALGHNLSFFNFLVSANMLWWPHYSDRERRGTLAAIAHQQALAHDRLGGDSLPSLDGGSAAAIALPAAVPDPVLALAEGEWTGASAITFSLGEGSLRADQSQRRSADVIVGRTARSLGFLHYAQSSVRPLPTWGYVNPLGIDSYNLLGAYVVTYADGSVEEAPIRFADNVAAPGAAFGEDVSSSPFWAAPAWEGRDRASAAVTLWSYEWVNPHPEKPIATVGLSYRRDEPGEEIALVALSAIE